MNTRKFYGSKPMTSFTLALPQSDSGDDLCNSNDSDDETIFANGESLLLDTDIEDGKTTDDETDNDTSENCKYIST